MTRSTQAHGARRGTIGRRCTRPVCESLEGRQLLSGFSPMAVNPQPLPPVAVNPQPLPPQGVVIYHPPHLC
jgi:hypothetical protein